MKLFLMLSLFSFGVFSQDLSQYRYDAIAGTPLITKTSHSGFTRMDYRRGETCKVFMDKVEITRLIGRVKYIELVDVFFYNEVVNVAKATFNEPANKAPNRLCDGPGTSIMALNNAQKGLIYSTGGCGNDKVNKNGVNSETVKAIVGKYCPKTH